MNPDVDPKTHPYISTGLKANKFGVAFDDAREAYRHAAAMAHLDVVGIDCHIGSQITEIAPYLDALDKVLDLVEQIEADGTTIQHIDVGGGLGITYDDETPPDIGEFSCARCSRSYRCSAATATARCISSRAARWSAMRAFCSRASSS